MTIFNELPCLLMIIMMYLIYDLSSLRCTDVECTSFKEYSIISHENTTTRHGAFESNFLKSYELGCLYLD